MRLYVDEGSIRRAAEDYRNAAQSEDVGAHNRRLPVATRKEFASCPSRYKAIDRSVAAFNKRRPPRSTLHPPFTLCRSRVERGLGAARAVIARTVDAC